MVHYDLDSISTSEGSTLKSGSEFSLQMMVFAFLLFPFLLLTVKRHLAYSGC